MNNRLNKQQNLVYNILYVVNHPTSLELFEQDVTPFYMYHKLLHVPQAVELLHGTLGFSEISLWTFSISITFITLTLCRHEYIVITIEMPGVIIYHSAKACIHVFACFASQ